MALIDGYQLEETIKEFRFNELGGISILKKWRELAVICQIDIEIVSISRDNYRNYASIPAHGFYGYATIILRDFALPPIKITQSRQTLYYARNDAALANWFTFLQSARAQENYKAIENLICFNTGLLGGACTVVPCKDIPVFRFDEIPLREVMVKADYGTQFKIEYSFWSLLPDLNACGDIVTPKSNQADGSKDSGLPPNGSSPQSGNPNNPYAGLPPADGIEKEGVLSLSKLNNQDNPNPDNVSTAPRPYILNYQGESINGSGTQFLGQGSIEILYNPVQSLTLALGELIYTHSDSIQYFVCRLLIDGVYINNVGVTTPFVGTGFRSACTVVSLIPV